MANFQETKIKTSILLTLTLLFLLIGIIPLGISNWRVIQINKRELETNLQESFLASINNVSSDIASYLEKYSNQIHEFVPKALSEQEGQGQAQTVLPSLMEDANFLKVRILDLAGNGPYAQRSDFQDPHVTEMEYDAFQRALQGESYAGMPYYDKQDDIVISLLAEPIRNDSGKVVGTLSAIVSLNRLLKIIQDESTGGKLVYVVDEKGNLLLHPKSEEMVAHKNLSESAIISDFIVTKGKFTSVRSYTEKDKDGDEVEILGCFAAIGDTGWGVIMQIEKDTAFLPVRKMIRESARWGIFFALAAGLVGILFARWITRPIQVLTQHVQDVGRNRNFDKKIAIKASNEIQALADTFNYMTEEIKQHVLSLQAAAQENKELFMSSIRMLSAAIDAKDPYTRGHSERVKDYTMVIARQMGFKNMELERIEISALLHDVGKIGIDDRILRKPTNLTPEEFEIMKTHPDKGASIMGQVKQLQDVIPGMRGHHENWDGSGYPQGLKADQIHLFARIITVADTFDAMTTDRPYQKAFTLEFALNRIRTMASIKYDPRVVESFSKACEEGKIQLHKPSRPRPKQPVA